jgi:hypothetical protein
MFGFHKHEDSRPLTLKERQLRERRHWRGNLLDEVRHDHGGMDGPASLVGALVAIAAMGLFGALAVALFGSVIYDVVRGGDSQDAWGAIAAGILVVLLSFFAGGWTAARSARYSGVANAVGVVIWTLLIAVGFSALGWAIGKDEPLLDLMLPNWLTTSDFKFTPEAMISAAAGIGVMLVGAILGGLKGAAYHRGIDRELTAEPEDMEVVEVEDEVVAAPAEDRPREVHVEPVETFEPVDRTDTIEEVPAVDDPDVIESDPDRNGTVHHHTV